MDNVNFSLWIDIVFVDCKKIRTIYKKCDFYFFNLTLLKSLSYRLKIAHI